MLLGRVVRRFHVINARQVGWVGDLPGDSRRGAVAGHCGRQVRTRRCRRGRQDGHRVVHALIWRRGQLVLIGGRCRRQHPELVGNIQLLSRVRHNRHIRCGTDSLHGWGDYGFSGRQPHSRCSDALDHLRGRRRSHHQVGSGRCCRWNDRAGQTVDLATWAGRVDNVAQRCQKAGISRSGQGRGERIERGHRRGRGQHRFQRRHVPPSSALDGGHRLPGRLLPCPTRFCP